MKRRIVPLLVLSSVLGASALFAAPTPVAAQFGTNEEGDAKEEEEKDHAIITVTVHGADGEKVMLPREVTEFGKQVELSFEKAGEPCEVKLSAERIGDHKARVHVDYKAGGKRILRKGVKTVALPGTAHWETSDASTLLDVKVRLHHDVKLDFGDDPMG